MKRIIKDALFGLLIIIAVTILEFIVTIPFGEPAQQITGKAWAQIINRESFGQLCWLLTIRLLVLETII